jgi:hypothetical protein
MDLPNMLHNRPYGRQAQQLPQMPSGERVRRIAWPAQMPGTGEALMRSTWGQETSCGIDAPSSPSVVQDPERAWRVLAAPGVRTLVAVAGGRVVGFVQMQSGGQIQAHLPLILVPVDRRREGIATQLVGGAFKQCGTERVDAVTDRAAEFYRSFAGEEWHRFRIYP